MKRKNIYLLSGAMLVLAIIYISLPDTKSSLKKETANFSFNSAKSATSIHIKTHEEFIRFIKTSEGWIIEDEFTVNPKMINVVWGALQNLRMQSPVSVKDKQILRDTILNHGTELSVLKDNKAIYHLQFIDINGRTIALSQKNEPFYINIHGYKDISLGQIIKSDQDNWKDKLLINLRKDQISEIALNYATDKQNSFSIKVLSDSLILYDFDGRKELFASNEELSDYLHFFKGVSYETPDYTAHSITEPTPNFNLTINTLSQSILTIEAYKLENKDTQKESSHIFAAIINRQDTVFAKFTNFDAILVKKDYFLKK